MLFLKYRHKFAHGYGNWEYTEEYGHDIDYLNETLQREHDWSDKYRGMDVEVIECPPKEWLEKRIERMYSILLYYSKTSEELTKLLKTL
jgi:hypothetical protein